MFIRKILILLFALILSTNAFTSTKEKQSTLGNFFAGITGGMISGIINSESSTYNEHDGSTGAAGSAVAGYDRKINNKVHIALQGQYGLTSLHTENTYTFGNYYESFKLTSFAGISVLPAYQLNENVLSYIQIGYILGRTKTDDRGRTTVNTSSGWKSGLQLGLGFQTPIYKRIQLQLGYNYLLLSTISAGGVDYKYRLHLFQLGLIYLFG